MSSILVGLSVAGIAFSLWFAAVAFIVPIMMRSTPFTGQLIFIITGLILSAVYSVIHYKLHGIVSWPAAILGAFGGGLVAYFLHTLAGSSWALDLWVAGLAIFIVPPIGLSAVKTVMQRKSVAVATVVEPVEPAKTPETTPLQQPIQPETQTPTPAQPSPSIEPVQVAIETVGPTASQITIFQDETRTVSTLEKVDSEDLEEFILDFIDQKRITELVPVQSPTADGGSYPAIQEEVDVDTARLSIILRRLLEKGIIKIAGIEFKRIACPRCFSSSVMFAMSCKSCKSPNISRQRILQHESCGFLGPEERFFEGGRYMCPRCGTEVSVAKEEEEEAMHDRVKVHSSLFICYQCNEVNNEPYVTFRCITCNMDFDYNGLELKTFYRYNVNIEMLSRTSEHNKPMKIMTESIRALGYTVQKNAKVVGSSNLAHRADLLISKNGVNKALLMFLKSDRKDEQVNNMMRVMTMKLDLPDLDFYLFSYFPLHPEAKKLADLFNIWYVDSVLSRDLTALTTSLFGEKKAGLR